MRRISFLFKAALFSSFSGANFGVNNRDGCLISFAVRL